MLCVILLQGGRVSKIVPCWSSKTAKQSREKDEIAYLFLLKALLSLISKESRPIPHEGKGEGRGGGKEKQLKKSSVNLKKQNTKWEGGGIGL